MQLKFKGPKNSPAFATPEQYVKARNILGLSLDAIPDATDRSLLPVDKNSVKLIEDGQTPHPPTHSTGAKMIDYAGAEKFYGVLDYKTRLHLFYQLKGIVFFEDGDVKKVHPLDLWGHLANTDAEYVQQFANHNVANFIDPDRFDVLRHLLKNSLASGE